MSSFATLGVHKNYIKSLKELGIKTPTEIQQQAIPILINSKTDLIGLAQTGTGKTAAYGLPILHNINPKKDVVQALILSPTRELVQQIKKQLFKFTKYNDTKIFCEGVYGGEKIDIQIKNLKRTTHIIVATPGRLVDLINREIVDLKNIETLVLDEADEMLSMGFKTDLTTILKTTKGNKNTWLFSATMPADLKDIVKRYIKEDAVRLEINKNSLVNDNISHYFVETSLQNKMDALVAILEEREDERGIIFCRTKAGTQALTHQLQQEGFNVAALEGDMQQREREKVMRAFKNTSLQILISTDVSARGIDVNNLGFVIHHQLPEHLEYYTHRSGRTARAGKKGESIALVLPNEVSRIQEIEKSLGIKIKQKTL
ncbi:DEAD/DEAH box helicase [Oceanihabitans sediminis]|uniref:DEAD/DEAH box helicase n=1 Tax=Oceanihabitans sediminis TaxID=1812012 RepID=A0A368P4M9_9FLAO|nr:DEAD/DEAH box helicase [Oceanihabitans sediminis]MDX1277230.1 DEAD/DEAH box helicase [Oceanihabitans sediminis]MDX1773649.1 DEAD/DEAH box helicase [Oceanihabitans sediminis]RBP33093.1 ATP-dependent RNA helicase DeaD [Oceanihabitans sediminis]RCU57396.1 DEAD/DEAH box helicase [Oceanihabitans sediminis]